MQLEHSFTAYTTRNSKWPRDLRHDTVKLLEHRERILWHAVLSRFSRVQLFVTSWTVVHQAPLSTKFSWQEYWSGLPCCPLGVLPTPAGIEPAASALQADSLPLSHLGSLFSDINSSNLFSDQSPKAKENKGKNKQMGPNQTFKLLHSKWNHKQNKMTTYGVGEKICK